MFGFKDKATVGRLRRFLQTEPSRSRPTTNSSSQLPTLRLAGGAEMSLLPSLVRSQDMDGIYDIPLQTTDTVRIPPYSIVRPKGNALTIAGETSTRGYNVTKWSTTDALSMYVPRFIVVDGNGIEASSGSTSSPSFGYGSFLHLGGFVAHATADDQGNTVTPGDGEADPSGFLGGTKIEETWGPKPGSFLLTPGYGGFRTLQGSQNIIDPVTGGNIAVTYAYQMPSLPAAWVTVGVSVAAPATSVETQASLSLITDTSTGGYPERHFDLTGGNTLAVKTTGLYEFTWIGQPVLSGWVAPLPLTESFTLRAKHGNFGSPANYNAPFTIKVWGFKDQAGNTILVSPAFSYHGVMNLVRGDTFYVTAQSNNTFVTTITGQLTVRRVGDPNKSPSANGVNF